MRSEVIGLSGGRKNLYLRVHRQEILEFYSAHGLLDTMTEFNIQFDTLQNILRDSVKDKLKKQPVRNGQDKIVTRLEIAEAAVRVLAGQQRKLIEDFGNFVPNVADTIAKKYLVPGIIDGLARVIMDNSTPLPDSDQLNLKNEAKSHQLYVMESPNEDGENLT